MFVTQFVRSLNIFFVPLYLACILLLVLPGRREGVVLWSDATQLFVESIGLLVPVFAGVAAVEAGLRKRVAAQATPARPSWVISFSHWAAHTSWNLVAMIAAFLIMTGFLAAQGVWGTPIWVWLFAGISGGVFASAIGYLAGAIFGFRWFTAPLIAVAVFYGWVIVSRAGGDLYWTSLLYPISLQTGSPFVTYIYSTFMGQILWYLASALLLVLLAGWTQSHRVHWFPVAAVAVTIVALVGATVIHSTGGQATRGHNPRMFTCASSAGMEICVHPAFRKGIPALQRAFGRFNDRVGESSLRAVVLEQNGFGIGDLPAEGSRSLYLEDLSEGFADRAVADYVEKYGGARECTDGESARVNQMTLEWAIGVGDPDKFEYSGDILYSAATRFYSWTEEQRRAWFTANVDEIVDCAVGVASIGGAGATVPAQ